VYDAEGEIRTPLQVAGRRLIFGTNAGTLHVVNARSGEEVWPPFRAERGIPAAPLLRDGVLYVPSLDHHLYAVELESGQLLLSLDLGHGLATTPAWIEGGWLTLGSNRGDVIAVDVERGEVVWRYPVNQGQPDEYGRPFPVLGGPAVRDGVVYVGAGDGRLYALPWHGGAWEQASEALGRVGRVEGAAACLALSAARDAERRAARFLAERGRADLAARVYEALGRVTDAARAYEQAARATSGAEAAALWEQAGNLWLRLDESRRAQRARRWAAQARGDPLLDLEWLGDTAFCQGEASHIHLRVRNPTSIIARELRVIASGPGFTRTERWRAELVHGDTWDCRLERLVSECAGAASLHVEARCEGMRGREIVYRWQFQIQVASRGQPPTVINVARQFTGPAHVVEMEGDVGMMRMDGAVEPGSASVEVRGDVGMIRSNRSGQQRENGDE
jgi:tetratricopeptide (TPR) repeat protein